ncbi:hypothetical protein [Candidatus Frankia alpina]|uniref:Uncharacterized protein n=1 Tax=Candidatus Frankia alpina TaxID=2699483 RepID=A0A4S5C2P8_9ACTN|nr:hypothetical protein [Candidatus Frankia alpina]THJ36756.1 hypothetical protein E7Y31_21915 [Candidatus Frankia alpina]
MYVVFHAALLLGVTLLLPHVARQATAAVHRVVDRHRTAMAAVAIVILAAHPSATGLLALSAGVGAASITMLVMLVRWSR